jgi:outer membrane protein assembly factor BamD
METSLSAPRLLTQPKRPALLALAAGLIVAQALVAACSSTPKDQSTAKKAVGGTDEQIFLGDTIEKNYDPNVIMKRGEAFFEKEEYAEAIVEYNHFLDLHRIHMLAPYAAFRIGESHMKMAKTIDRDPEPMYKAIAALERMRKDFPGSRYDGQAQQKIQECHDWLAQTHLFVGEFYYRRGSYLAAAHRFEKIMKDYPDKPVAPDALYFLAQTYHELGADDWAVENLTLLAEKYPGSNAAGDGKSLLAKLGGSKSGTLLAKKTDASAATTFSDITPAGSAAGGSGLSGTLPSASSSVQSTAPRTPAANAFGQAFTACRLGAWC